MFSTFLALFSLTLAPVIEKPEYQLPKDSKAVVITLDFKGGFTPPRVSKDPYLTIHADGTVVVNEPFQKVPKKKGKISKKELKALLKFAIEDNNFFQFDVAKVKAAVKAEQQRTGMGVAIADAATVHIRIRTAKKDHEASYYALGFYAKQYPKVKELGQLYAVQKKLNQVMNVVKAGGKKAVKEIIKLANKHLKKQYPDAPALKAEDLQSVFRRPDGSTFISLHRSGIVEGKKGTYISVSIQQNEKGEPNVNVRAKLK